MWPWGHLALGYLCYSAVAHARRDEGVTDLPVLALVVATQLPDVVDKTLSWVMGVFPAGYAVGHSALVAVPVSLAVLAAAAHRDRPAVGVAFVVGHWSHLAGDVLLAVALDRPYTVERVLWPAVSLPATHAEGGVVERVVRYLRASGEVVGSGAAPAVTLLFVVPPLAAVALWIRDGTPGLTPVATHLRASTRLIVRGR